MRVLCDVLRARDVFRDLVSCLEASNHIESDMIIKPPLFFFFPTQGTLSC
jgi:hypothetical protein